MEARRAPLLLLALLVGCASTEPTRTDAERPSRNAEVRVDGEGLELGESSGAGLSRAALLDRCETLLRAERRTSAALFAGRRPDLVLSALRAGLATEARRPSLAWLAELRDRELPRPGWAPALAQVSASADAYADFAALRHAHWQHLTRGQFVEAAELALRAALPGLAPAPLAADALQLEGEARLLAGSPEEAAACFAEAAGFAAFDPRWRAGLLLLEGESRRRTGAQPAAASLWREAARAAAELLTAETLRDPILWERIAYLKPFAEPWPEAVGDALAASLARSDPLCSFPDRKQADARGEVARDALLWSVIGHARLARAETQAALLAFARAEAGARRAPSRAALRLAQARALAQLGQREAASAILTPLLADEEAEIFRPALACLGVLELQQQRTARGLTLLERACVGAEPWPGRARAEADLGLACLLAGREDEGLERLSAAEAGFAAAGATGQLLRSLENRLAYLELREAAGASALRERLAVLEAEGG